MPDTKRFIKGNQDIEIEGNEFKIFLRPDKPVVQSYLSNLLKYIRSNAIVIIPFFMTVIVVSKNGEVKTL